MRWPSTLLPENERGITNGFMFASSYIGSFLGGAVVGGILLRSGVPAAVACEMLILLVIAMFPIMFRERRGDAFLVPRAVYIGRIGRGREPWLDLAYARLAEAGIFAPSVDPGRIARRLRIGGHERPPGLLARLRSTRT